jgi:DNA-binding LacI/PurR family transcriptional regulator
MDDELSSSMARKVSVSLARHPTISDVARAAGVSVGTVSNVLNGKGRHSAATRARVIRAASSLYYRPNALIRSLQTGTTNTVGVFTWRIYLGAWHDMTLDLLRGISRGLALKGRDMLLYARHPHEGDVEPAYFLDGRVDAVILAPGGLSPADLEQLATTSLPIVTLYQSAIPPSVASVRIDNASGIAAIMDHLVALGHRRIAFVSPVYSDDFRERRQAYWDGLERHALAFSQEWSSLGMLPRETEVGAALQSLISMRDRPTALVCGNDGVALSAIQALSGMGLSVPADVSVTGFDDSPASASADLTTIRQPAETVGSQAAEYVEALLSGARGQDCRITLPVMPIFRGSAAPPRQRGG